MFFESTIQRYEITLSSSGLDFLSLGPSDLPFQRQTRSVMYWDDRDSNPDALSGCRFSHHYGFRHREDRFAFVGPDCALTIRVHAAA
jgi:hypothetical protein